VNRRNVGEDKFEPAAATCLNEERLSRRADGRLLHTVFLCVFCVLYIVRRF